MEDAGLVVKHSALFDDRYLQRAYASTSKSPASVLARYMRRAIDLCRRQPRDLLWIEKELFPYLPAWFETMLRQLGVRYVADYDDALFHSYDSHESQVVRRLLGEKIDVVMRSSVLVTAGNEYLASRAVAAGASWVEIVPSVVDVTRYKRPGPLFDQERTRFRIGWIGTPITARFLRSIAGAITEFQRETAVEFVVIGANEADVPGMRATFLPWSEASEADLIASLDVGIMPLEDNPWERGKCGYKLIQYMAAGLPTIASPVGANAIIVKDGHTGLLATSPSEWLLALRRLRDDHTTQRAMGLAGRQRVEREYSLDVVAPRVVQLVQEAATRPVGSRS